jgi:hypothetical protein
MNMKIQWTSRKIEVLTEKYRNHSTKDIAAVLGCSVNAIYSMANILGLKKDREFIAATARRNSSDPDHGGRKHLFKKGNVPHSRGRKQTEYMSPEGIENSRKTCFKKGRVPHNHRPVGSERITDYGYIEVKVSEPNKWKLKHRLLWERHNGSIPKGANIQFRDGNPQNCRIENLYLITRQNQMTENSGSLNMPDGMVAFWLNGTKNKDKEAMAAFKQNRPLLELKRNQLKLSRIIKKIEQ